MKCNVVYENGTTKAGTGAHDVYNWVSCNRREPVKYIEFFISEHNSYDIDDIYKAFAHAYAQEFMDTHKKLPELFCIYAKQTHHWADEWEPSTPYSYHRTLEGALVRLKEMQDQYNDELTKFCAEETQDGDMEFRNLPFEIYPLMLRD